MPKKKKAKVVEEVEYVSKVYPKGCYCPENPKYKITYNNGSHTSSGGVSSHKDPAGFGKM